MSDKALGIYKDAYRRNDLQGLRVAAAINIAIYHIWIQKVSGGVDVFFVISGLLLTASLLRANASDQTYIAPKFWWKVICRIMPSALFVIAVTALASIYFVPAPLWKHGTNELIASLLNVENFELMRRSTDYLDRQSPPSQFQQMWALSVQFQYYAVLPLIAAGAVVMARVWGPKGAVGAFIFLAIAGFSYALFALNADQAAAYFSPLARVWQFAVGGALAALYPLIKGRSFGRLSAIAYALGFAIIIASGAVFPANASFPGFPALAPVTGVILMVIAGAGAGQNVPALQKLLSSAPLVSLSKFSFGFYLWHWPLLIFEYHRSGSTDISLLQGTAIIGLAGLLAALTYKFVEKPSMAALKESRKAVFTFIVIYAVLVVGAVGVRQYIVHLGKGTQPQVVASQPYSVNGSVPLKFPLTYWMAVDYDRASGGTRCRGTVCVHNDTATGPTYLLYGSSHAAQWTDLIIELAKRNNARLVTAIAIDDYASQIARVKPDVVITIGSTTSEVPVARAESAATDQFELWSDLAGRGVPVIAIRDNHRFHFYQNACLWENADNPGECALERKSVFAQAYPLLGADTPANVTQVDFTDIYCNETTCPASVNGVVVFYDKHHFTRSFLTYISEMVLPRLQKAIDHAEGKPEGGSD